MKYTITEGNYKKFGVQTEKDGIIFTFEGAREDDCFLLLYNDKGSVISRMEVPKEYCIGSVRSICLHGMKEKQLRYNYEINGEIVVDTYARKIFGREKWNDAARAAVDYQIYSGIETEDFDWEGDMFPEIAKNEMFIYKLHVRGFSMDAGIRGKEKGTFAAVKNKLSYLKELGVTAIELMPVYEFEELILNETPKLPEYLKWESREEDLIKPEPKQVQKGLNYWGYTSGNYFAVKSSYSSGQCAAVELKSLIREMHKNQIECIMEMYFAEGMNQNVILDVLRFWVREFHVDGFHLIGNTVPVTAIAQDLFLSRTKLFYQGFESFLYEKETRYPHLYVYNDEYLYPARKLLNQYDGRIEEFANQQRKQHGTVGFVNYIANNNGFTLADIFAYQEKHNEANGEGNTDGNSWNFSSNCGFEGKTGKKYVNMLRKKQAYNALAMLFLAQGVPLLLSGDEMGNTQGGNNNAYCQDNKTGWLNWKHGMKQETLRSFVKALAAFRKAHPIICQNKPMQLNDYGHRGCPDLSYHGENAWISEFMRENKAFGTMYCGDYMKNEEGISDDYVYVGYNFKPGATHLALPKLPAKKKWYLCCDTMEPDCPFLEKEKLLENQHLLQVKAQSIVILLGK